jgi:hypothetical protein
MRRLLSTAKTTLHLAYDHDHRRKSLRFGPRLDDHLLTTAVQAVAAAALNAGAPPHADLGQQRLTGPLEITLSPSPKSRLTSA